MFVQNFRKTVFVISFFFIQYILMVTSSFSSDGLKLSQEDHKDMIEQIKLEVELDKKLYAANEPITIKGKITNLEKNTINLAPLLSTNLLIYVKYQDENARLLGTFLLIHELIKKENIIMLQMGESHIFERKIYKEAYSMPNRKGQYELYVICKNGVKQLENIRLWVGEEKSNTVKCEIK